MRFLGGDGLRCGSCRDAEEALSIGDDQVDVLLTRAAPFEDVALLTTGSRHPEQVARQAEGTRPTGTAFLGCRSRWFYGHVLGLRARSGAPSCWWSTIAFALERARENACTSLSRARDQLVVCGDPDFITGGRRRGARTAAGYRLSCVYCRNRLRFPHRVPVLTRRDLPCSPPFHLTTTVTANGRPGASRHRRGSRRRHRRRRWPRTAAMARELPNLIEALHPDLGDVPASTSTGRSIRRRRS